jgi:hypothetical protein
LHIRDNGPDDEDLGICFSLMEFGYHGELHGVESWPKFSGNSTYPVPETSKTPGRAFFEIRNMWDNNTEYGRNRWELLDFLIDYIEKKMGY